MMTCSISRERISQSTLLKTSRTFDSKFSFETSRGTPATSKHSLLEYWSFAQHCLSISITLLLRSVLTFLTILISDSSLTKFSLNLSISSRASLFTLVYCSTLFWSDKVVPISSFFDNLSNVLSVQAATVETFGCRSKLQ